MKGAEHNDSRILIFFIFVEKGRSFVAPLAILLIFLFCVIRNAMVVHHCTTDRAAEIESLLSLSRRLIPTTLRSPPLPMTEIWEIQSTVLEGRFAGILANGQQPQAYKPIFSFSSNVQKLKNY